MRKKKQQPIEHTMTREEYIVFLSCKSNLISVSTQNKKTGPLVNDIAFPTCTCRDDAPCKVKGQCYCMKGTQTMATVQAAYLRNLRLYHENPTDFWEQVAYIIKHRPCPKLRWFDCGDFPDKDFIIGTYAIADKFPDIKFLAFTKHYDWVNEVINSVGPPPENFTIRFSAWDKNWNVPNPHNLPVAYVDFADSSLNPDFPKNCVSCLNQKDKTITCSVCSFCWDKNKTVKFIQH